MLALRFWVLQRRDGRGRVPQVLRGALRGYGGRPTLHGLRPGHLRHGDGGVKVLGLPRGFLCRGDGWHGVHGVRGRPLRLDLGLRRVRLVPRGALRCRVRRGVVLHLREGLRRRRRLGLLHLDLAVTSESLTIDEPNTLPHDLVPR